jgi:hypothetical protein
MPMQGPGLITALRLDIVVGIQEQKCGLKYVIHSPGGPSFSYHQKGKSKGDGFRDMVSTVPFLPQ